MVSYDSASIMAPLEQLHRFTFTFSHLADAFIQSDLHLRTGLNETSHCERQQQHNKCSKYKVQT